MVNCENNAASLEKQKEIFNQILSSCMKDYPQTRLRPFPVLIAQGKHVDLYEVSTRVRDLGGYVAVTENRLWSTIASQNLGLEPSCGPTLKLVFAKYLKLVEKWLQRGCTSRSRSSILGGPAEVIRPAAPVELPAEKRKVAKRRFDATEGISMVVDLPVEKRKVAKRRFDAIAGMAVDLPAEKRKVAKRRIDDMAGMVECVRSVARNGVCEVKGSSFEECVTRALKARKALFSGTNVLEFPSQWKQKIHPIHYEERMKEKNEGFARQLVSPTFVPVYDFPPQPFSPSSCVASFLPGVHPVCGMVVSIRTDEDIQQNSEKLPSICNDASGYKFNCKEHIPRKRVRIGSEFQAEVAAWNSPLKNSPVQMGNEDSSFSRNMDDSRWLLTPIWSIENCELVVNKGRIGKGRSDGCSCAIRGSIECVKLHVKVEREKLKEELGAAFSDWRFEDMGDAVSEKWSGEERQKFSALVRLNPASLEKNFWNHLPTCLPSKKIEELVSYYFNVFVLTRRGIQNRAEPYNIDSDDDESEVGSGLNENLHVLKHTGSINKVSVLKFDHSENKSGSQACCISGPNFSLKRLSISGEDALILPHLEDDNSIDGQKQHRVVPSSHGMAMEYLRMLQEKDFEGAISVEKL